MKHVALGLMNRMVPRGEVVPYMNGNDYWPDIGENILELVEDMRQLARERGQITVCIQTRRVPITAGMSSEQVKAALAV